MRIEGLTMQPFNTTLMGVVKGVLDYYGITMSSPMAFGASGHAFLINIHTQLCPSGPYCWDYRGFRRLIGNLGLEMKDLGFFAPTSSGDDRRRGEHELREALDQGIPCSLLNLENQMITGCDDAGFFTTQPWAPRVDFPPARLSFGTWAELGEEFHVNFFTFGKRRRADDKAAVLESLDYAVDLHRNPSHYSSEGYGVGPEAYANWKAAVAEHGSGHGNWWNATVWCECRRMASEYFAEISRKYSGASESARRLAAAYGRIADTLDKLRDKGMPAAEKAELVEQAESAEAEAMGEVAALAASLRSGDGDFPAAS